MAIDIPPPNVQVRIRDERGPGWASNAVSEILAPRGDGETSVGRLIDECPIVCTLEVDCIEQRLLEKEKNAMSFNPHKSRIVKAQRDTHNCLESAINRA